MHLVPCVTRGVGRRAGGQSGVYGRPTHDSDHMSLKDLGHLARGQQRSMPGDVAKNNQRNFGNSKYGGVAHVLL